MRKKSDGVVIYQAKSGAIEFRGDMSRETIWATQAQMATAFEVNTRTVNEHIQNILKTKELREATTVRNFRIVRTEGKREVEREVKHYNLDMVLSVGYRVNSKKATLFRQWATKTLRGYVINGYAINKNRIAKNYTQFMSVIEDIKKLLPADSATESKDIVELISLFADTWLSLDAYDKELLPKGKLTKRIVKLTADSIVDNLTHLKQSLLEGGQATDIFGRERSEGNVSGIVGNVMQSFGGKELYPTTEEKAASILDTSRLTPSALTALTIMVAESSPEHKEKVIRLILNLISK